MDGHPYAAIKCASALCTLFDLKVRWGDIFLGKDFSESDRGGGGASCLPPDLLTFCMHVKKIRRRKSWLSGWLVAEGCRKVHNHHGYNSKLSIDSRAPNLKLSFHTFLFIIVHFH